MFSLLGLTVVLALMLLLVLLAAIGLGPGDSGSLGPVPAPPHFEAEVGESVPLGSRHVTLVANGVVASGIPVSVTAGSVAGAGRPSEGEARSDAPAVGSGQAIAVAAPAPQPESGGAGNEVPSVETTAGEVSPEGTSSPVAAPLPGTEGGGPGRPVAAGGPVIEACEGDEYVIAIVLSLEASEEEEQSVEIVLTKISEDRSTEELRLEGDLLDAQSLALQLSSEGNCVYLKAGTPEEDGVPSGETSPAVVSTEGTPSSAAVPVPGDSGPPGAP